MAFINVRRRSLCFSDPAPTKRGYQDELCFNSVSVFFIMDPETAGSTALIYIFSILTLPMMLFSAYVFVRHREHSLVKARSRFMTIFIWFFMLLVSYYQIGLAINVEPCLPLMWTDNIFVGTLVWAVLIDCIRLLVIFNWACSKFEYDDESDSKKAANEASKPKKIPWYVVRLQATTILSTLSDQQCNHV